MSQTPIHRAVPAFVQIFRGPIRDAATARELFERWFRELAPGADGWLGTTAGVTDDGELIAIVSFASQEAARRNSQRPEQRRWWEQLSGEFTGDVTLHDCPRVTEFAGGTPAEAGFVQVIQGWASDLSEVTEVRFAEIEEHHARGHHLDVAGGFIADHGDGGGFTEAVYFPSEQAARQPEIDELLEEGLASMQRLSTFVTNIRSTGIRDVWLQNAPADTWEGG